MKKKILILISILCLVLFVIFTVKVIIIKKELSTNDTQKLVHYGLKYSKKKNYMTALIFFDEAIKKSPKDFRIYVLKSEIYYKLKDFKNMYEAINKAYEIEPNNYHIVSLKAFNYYNSQEFKKALEYFHRAQKINENEEIYFAIAKTYDKLRDFKNVIKYSSKIIAKNPDFIDAYILRAKACGDMRDYKCSLSNYETLKNKNPNEPYFYFMTSLYSHNTRNLAGALDNINKAIEISKEPISPYYAEKAWILLDMGKKEECFENLEYALKLDPRDDYVLSLLMVLASDVKNYDKAIEYANKILKDGYSKDENHALRYMLAKLYYVKGKKDLAIKNIDLAIKIAPENLEYKEKKEKILNGEEI